MQESQRATHEGFDGGAVSLFEVQAKERDVADTQARIAQLKSNIDRSDEQSEQDRRLETESYQAIQTAQIKLTRDNEDEAKSILFGPHRRGCHVHEFAPARSLSPPTTWPRLFFRQQPLAEVWIPNDSMRRIKPQLPVRMKLNAYPYQQFGLLQGTIVSVDPDANEAGAYRASDQPDRLTLDGAHGPEALRTGLTLTAEIVVDQRSVLDVILNPIRRVKRGFALAE